mmetsp:Transcript_3535/g.5013  ORF Transcript_3535/g.5013 Transcript_3535/m.5013 type:complete len:237 (+) Transcript_3535:300-1010(+)
MSISANRLLLFCAAKSNKVLPRSSSASILKPRLRDSSTRLTRPFLAWLNTVSIEGTPMSLRVLSANSSISTASCMRFSCIVRGFSFSRFTMILRTCSLCLMFSTCTRSSSRSSSKNGPSTEASTNPSQYWPSDMASSQRDTSVTVHVRTFSGKDCAETIFNSRSAFSDFSISAFFFCILASMKSLAPRFSFFTLGRLAAAAAPAAAAAASADIAIAADVVSAFMSRKDLSMFNELK